MEPPLIGPGRQHVTRSCDESGFGTALQTARRGWRGKGREAGRAQTETDEGEGAGEEEWVGRINSSRRSGLINYFYSNQEIL